MKTTFSTALLTCSAAFTLSTVSIAQTADDTAIRDVQARQADAWNRHDATAYANLFTEDGEVVNVVGWWWKGRSQIESRLTDAFAFVFRDSRMMIVDVQTRHVGPGLAIAHVLWTMTGAKTPPGIPEPRAGIEIQLLKKVDGKWLIYSFQNTNSVPERPFPKGPPTSSAGHAQILILGTGTPIIDAAHSGNSIGILVRGSLYIFDAGPGVERRMLEAVAKGTKIDTIPAVFITHLHSDHTLGLPALAYYHGRNAVFRGGGALTVYGPPGIAAMLRNINGAWADDRAARAGVRGDSQSWQVRGADVGAGIVYRDSNIVVKAFEVPHQPWPHAFGYRVETADRIIVISGDTKPGDAIARECAGCDVLLHEVYSAVGLPKAPPEMQKYHPTAHTSTYELADIAAKAKPKLLVLYHQLYLGGTSDDDLVREVRSRYNGRVVSAHDLDVF